MKKKVHRGFCGRRGERLGERRGLQGLVMQRKSIMRSNDENLNDHDHETLLYIERKEWEEARPMSVVDHYMPFSQ